MALRPFLKWAGGKRWLVERSEFQVPSFSGNYIEPFLGGGSVFFHVAPDRSIISDLNTRLVEAYLSIKCDWQSVVTFLESHQKRHSPQHYYAERAMEYSNVAERGAQFIYLNRACWNGLYRENLRGQFNVPIGSKTKILYEYDDFRSVSERLKNAEIVNCDFEVSINRAGDSDFLFVDPPYTTAHNFNGFVKYNQKIFSWDDQIRLRNALVRAAHRGCAIIVTNAGHSSISELYNGVGRITELSRASVISGKVDGRQETSEKVIYIGPR
ncbi:DNA adenine methylase [Aminobacter aminovorans]|uniref:Site-specific DNA-methyltransferase (adenine-specific) n=1 Tax=Aminobacter aminovorans TaxID=83263 RepID=A0AAC8YRR1_AMIAI|nr:Dam family site-specific DNA-(adenine-N6)-methyltransferase [Aminobacter aminovorans]AMS43293.1 DNA methyltransferase [Aminobacter aminovorans]MBB3706155.1 DNA adenine methylase [Aminobacter aminovorans]